MRILIVEDHLLFRELVKKVCVQELGFVDCEGCGSCAQAREQMEASPPDMLLLDLCLPDGDGFEVAGHAAEMAPGIKVVALSAHGDDYSFWRIERMGFQGFVDKNTDAVATLRLAIKTVAEGGTFFSETFKVAMASRRYDPNHFTKILSERECQVLTLIGEAYSDAEIGTLLGISRTTAQTHRSQIMRKLGLPGTPKLIKYSVEHGFARVRAPQPEGACVP